MGWTMSQSRNDGRYAETQSFSGVGLPVAFGGSNSASTGTVKTSVDAAATTSINGSTTTVEDQAGKKRRSITNALGQLIRVDEPDANDNLGAFDSPYQPTVYGYDVLNNLLTVTQASNTTTQCGGQSSCTQTRTFTYNSLSRLT